MADEFELIKAFVSAEVRGARRASQELNDFRRSADLADRELDELRASGRAGIDITGADRAADELDRIDRSAEGASAEVGRLRGAFGSLATVTAGVFGGITLDRFANFLGRQVADSLELARNFETASIQFRTLLRDEEAAATLLRQVQQFTTQTPFLQAETIPAARQLIAFGFQADEVIEVLRRLGDISAGTGAPLADLVEIFGRARLQGSLFAEEINRLTDRGIPALQGFADILGVNVSEIKKLASEGKVTFDTLEQLVRNLTGPGGQFEELTLELSFSAAGQISNIQGQIDDIKRDIGTTILPVQLRFLGRAATELQDLTDLLDQFGTGRLRLSALEQFGAEPAQLDVLGVEELRGVVTQLQAERERLVGREGGGTDIQFINDVFANAGIRDQIAGIDRLISRIDAIATREGFDLDDTNIVNAIEGIEPGDNITINNFVNGTRQQN